MKRENDMLDQRFKGTFRTPEGYFDDLKARLYTLPSLREAVPAKPAFRFRERMLPYLALAASFAALLIIGNAVLRRTVPETDAGFESYLELFASDLIPVTNPYEVFQDSTAREPIPEEGIIDILIESGFPVQLVALASAAE